MQPGHVPRLGGTIAHDRHRGRLEEVFGRRMLAMLRPDSPKQGELMVRTHMEFKWVHAWPFAVVHPFGVLAVSIAARLPIAFEPRLRSIGEGTELGLAERRHSEPRGDSETENQLPSRSPS